MAFAPDPCPPSGTPVHRLFVCEKAGSVRVFRNGVLQPSPFLTVSADTRGERGLDGICFDPNFAANHYVYVYYTVNPANQSQPTHNRLSRFTADPAHPDVAVAGSEVRILDLPDLALTSYVHNGGGLHFGPDGKLYISVGENGYAPNAQSLSTVLGKILRINPVPENPDGTNPESTFPTDNPFYHTAAGLNRAIYCLGVRNPFTFSFQPGSGRMFIDDVGSYVWEEINEGGTGRNFGWPTCEGVCQPPVNGLTNPLYAYQHFSGTPQGCAITGGAFYNPAARCAGDPPYGFPSSYVGQYFFIDFCSDWIYTMDPNQIDPASPYGFHTISPFASGIHGFPTYLMVGPDANLYYLSRTDGAIYQIRYPATLAPTIGTQPTNQLVGQGWPATFSISASGSPPLAYQWQRNGTNIPGATSPSYTLQNAQVATDNGATFRCVVTNAYGTTVSATAVLTVIPQQPPVLTLNVVTPRPNHYYAAGDTMRFSGVAIDPQDGQLPPSALTWQILFEHHPLNNPNHHAHPFFGPTSGISGGTVNLNFGETEPDVWYRVFFTAINSYQLTQTSYVDVFPAHAQLFVNTSPIQVKVLFDGAPKNPPLSLWSVVNTVRSLGVDSPQIVDGLFYDFVSWSDGGARFHNILTPWTPSSYIANFWKRSGYGSVTASPNPIQVTDGSGKGTTTLFWSSGQTNNVEVRLGAPAGQLVARSGSGNFSHVTNKVISDGTKFYLQDVSNNQPLTSAFTLDSVTLRVTAAAQGSITANPNPFVPDAYGFGQTNIIWTSYGTTAVEVHLNAPDGPLFAGSDPGTWSQPTQHWLTNGMTFYLQNVSNGLPLTPANTLATVTVTTTSATPVGSISASPNPFVPDPQGIGQTTLTWTSEGTTRVEVHANAPDGNLFAGTGAGMFSATTGHWVRDGMTFYLQNVSNGLPLTAANTLATITLTASP